MDKFMISCDICMDLIPLVQDGIAAEDSRKAVEEHIANCESCREAYGNNKITLTTDVSVVFRKVQRQIQTFTIVLMMLGMFFGVSFTASEQMFYNCIIMPIIGALGYMLLRWKAVYKIPILLILSHGVINLLNALRQMECLDIYSLFMWTFIYSMFVWLGVIIAWLLHYAFRKEA